MKRLKNHIPAKRAFTLIELLVVITIISILAAILFPVFARARENARRASCVSNLKQMGLGVMMYKQDYDGRFLGFGWAAGETLPCPGNASAACSAAWTVRIYPYIKNVQVYNCPSDTGTPWTGLNSGTQYVSYGFNTNLALAAEAAVQRPSQTIMMADTEGTTTYALYQNNYYNGADIRQISDRHLDGSVLNFADGHAKWMKLARDPGNSSHTVPPKASQGVYWRLDASS